MIGHSESLTRTAKDTWWDAYIASIRDCVQRAMYPDSGGEHSIDAMRYVIANLAQAYPLIMHGDPNHPQFISLLSNVYPFAAANPDTTYLFATLGEGGTYRITGKRNTVHWVDLQFGSDMAGFTETPGPGIASHNLDDFTIDDDGRFSIMCGPRQPSGHSGDFVHLDSANYLMVRQISIDWCAEEDALIAVERLDAPSTKASMSEALKRQKLEHLVASVERTIGLFTGMAKHMADKGIVNRLQLGPYANIGGASDQAYFEGLYEAGEDEALIIEAPLPDRAHYWGIQLADEHFWTLDYVHRQSSLNAANAHIDEDGVVRAVLAADDPGIQNWLDIEGFAKGIVMWRWQDCSDYPEPKIKKVPVSELRGHLPASTPSFSVDERAEQMRDRRIGAQLRRRC